MGNETALHTYKITGQIKLAYPLQERIISVSCTVNGDDEDGALRRALGSIKRRNEATGATWISSRVRRIYSQLPLPLAQEEA